MGIENDRHLRTLDVTQRGCRFNDELMPDSAHSVYSYSTCIVECRMKKHIELCNCTTAFMPRLSGMRVCTPNELNCLAKHYAHMNIVLQPWEDGDGIHCNCTLGCDELEITNIWNTPPKTVYEDEEEEEEFKLVLTMASLPSEKYRRVVSVTRLDLVVALGGTAGLFLGASLISGFEFFMFMFIRSCKSRKDKSATQTPAETTPINNVTPSWAPDVS